MQRFTPDALATQPAAHSVSIQPQERALEYHHMAMVFGMGCGIISADNLVARQGQQLCGGVGTVARLIVDRQAVYVHWKGTYWLPLFQFAEPGMQVHTTVSRILNELSGLMDDWDVALWFATRNDWLRGAFPADAIRIAPKEVFDAARAYRFALNG